MKSRLPIIIGLAILILGSLGFGLMKAWPEDIQKVIFENGLLTVHAKEISLKSLVNEISRKSNIQVSIDPGIEDKTIAVDFENQSIEQGLKTILQTAGISDKAVVYKKTSEEGKPEQWVIEGVYLPEKGITKKSQEDAALNTSGSTLQPSKEAGTPAGPSPQLPSPDPDSFRALYGYRGPYYRSDISGHNIVVLSQTLYQWPVTNWKVSGLVRNETGSHVKVTTVTARLFDASGKELGNATAWIPLDQLRPGEPAPFVITTSIPGSSVSKIDWHIDYTPSGPSNRLFQINPYWQLSFGNRQRHTGYPFDDPANPPYPYVVFGSFSNASTETVDNARLIGAWLDDQQRVIYVDWLSFLPAAAPGNVQKSISLEPGRAEDYIYQSADPWFAAQLSTATLLLWGIAY